MLCVNAFARAPAESLLGVYERRKQQQQRLYVFTGNSRHIAMKIFMNATLFDVQNVGNCISEDLDL